MKTNELLKERGTTHGDFTDNARVSQALKTVIYSEHPTLSVVQREALDMICHKLARIVCGEPKFIDAWRDLAGYAQLVVDRLQTTPGVIDVKQAYIVIE